MTDKEAIEALTDKDVVNPYLTLEALEIAIDALKERAERKTDKWIYHIDDLFPAESTKECDQCRTHQDLNCDGNFCPWCGAKMEVDE